MKTTTSTAIRLTLVLVAAFAWLNGRAASTDAPKDTTLYFDQLFSIGSGELSSAVRLVGFFDNIREIEDRDTTKRIEIAGRASIDGVTSLNERLARERAMILRDSIIEICKVSPHKIFISSIGEDWNLLGRLVRENPDIPARERVISTIESDLDNDQKESRLRGFAEGKTWEYLAQHIFPRMRSARVTWELSKRALPAAEPPVAESYEIVELAEEIVEIENVWPETEVIEPPVEKDNDDWYRKMYFKTNVPAWALLWQNLALEVDLARHWSFSVPVYWSPYNYGKQTLKFRTLAVVPEFRYWPKATNTGFFINAHFGMAYFNYAKGGEYRYQYHSSKTPALGGGLGIGYRFYFCRNHHWAMEVAVGGGAYKLDYDIYLNTPITGSGQIIGRRKRMFYGVDQAAFSISYSFGLRKKG